MADFDTVVRGGTVVTADGIRSADVGISGGVVRAVEPGLGRGEEELSAEGRLVIPGGVDAHTHIEQKSSMGLMCADDYHSGTVSAVCGGTTTVLSFAVQGKGASPREVVAAYHAAAGPKAVSDYGFHLIVADPTPQALEEEIPELVAEGVVSFKIYMTYDLVRLDDRQFLDVLAAARRMGALTMVHAENHDMIGWLSGRLVGEGHKAPKFHAAGHPKLAESEATGRAIDLAELVDAPLYIVHVSSKEAAEEIGAARRRGLKVFAETCPQYLLLTAEDLDKPGMEGAKFCCSPAPRGRGVPGGALGGDRRRHLRRGEFGPRALQLRRQGEAGLGTRAAVPEDLQRGARRRAADAAALLRRGREGADQPPALRRGLLRDAGAAFRPLPPGRGRSLPEATPTSRSGTRTRWWTSAGPTSTTRWVIRPTRAARSRDSRRRCSGAAKWWSGTASRAPNRAAAGSSSGTSRTPRSRSTAPPGRSPWPAGSGRWTS